MAVLEAKQAGIFQVKITYVDNVGAVSGLPDIKGFNHGREAGVLNSLINGQAGIGGIAVGYAAEEDLIIPAFPFYNLLRRQPVTAPAQTLSGSAIRLRITISLPSISSGIS